MRTLLVVLMVAMMLIAGCSGGSEPADETPDVEIGDDEVTVESGETELVVSTDPEKGVDLPEGYPETVLPVYREMLITAASKNDDGSYVVIGMSDDPIARVGAFYDEVLADAVVTMMERSDESYMSMGELKGMTYTVSVQPAIEELGHETMINLIIMPTLGMPSETTVASTEISSEGSGGVIIPDGLCIPDDYPMALLPLIEDYDGELAIAEIVGGRPMLGYMTKSPFEEACAHYEALLSGADLYGTGTQGSATIYSGMIEDIGFEVGITENFPDSGVDQQYLSMVQIFYVEQ